MYQEKWLNAENPPFEINGLAFYNREKLFRRLPASGRFVYSKGVEELAWNTSGVQVRFSAFLRTLRCKAALREYALFDHMTFIGKCGLDCYIGRNGTPARYFSSLRSEMKDRISGTLLELDKPEQCEIIINLPLYSGIHELLLGFDAEAVIGAPAPLASEYRAVFYGTSITQGGCANRPGMSYTNILSRMLGAECINLGFSGNGKGEPELARSISMIERAGLVVLDYEGNCNY